ncbi:VRR-NUC domain-containing protein [Bosea thiooxidans]
MQAAAVKWLRRYQQAGWPIRVEGDMNSARRTLKEAGQAKAMGLNPGTPDLRVYMPGARLLMVEYKRGTKGKRSQEQIDTHDQLTEWGFDVVTLAPSSEDEAIELTTALVASRLGLPIPHWEPPANDNSGAGT